MISFKKRIKNIIETIKFLLNIINDLEKYKDNIK